MPMVTGHTTPFAGLAVEQDVPMHRHTSFRVGGPAQYLARPGQIDELTLVIRAAGLAGIPVTILGSGTNVLVSDEGIKGLVILLTDMKGVPDISRTPEAHAKRNVIIRVLAGQPLSSLCRFAAEKGLSGLEWAAGIPGTLGGAIKMNAGSFGSDMAAVTLAAEILDLKTLTVRTAIKNELRFSYRSLDLEGAVVLGADLLLHRGNQEQIQALHDKNLKVKKNSQPVSKASAGCFFKNPSPGKPAGWLIEQAGLKGFRHGGAMVSELHANFIINHDNATCRDILDLAEAIRNKVHQKFNITLETEVKSIGS